MSERSVALREKLIFGWLLIVFLVSLFLRFSRPVQDQVEKIHQAIQPAERLTVVARFAEGLDSQTRGQLLDMAEQLETEELALKVLQGEPVPRERWSELSSDYRAMAAYQADPSAERLKVLERRAAQVSGRLQVSLAMILGLMVVGGGTLLIWWGEGGVPPDPPERSLTLVLGVFLAWDAVSVYIAPLLIPRPEGGSVFVSLFLSQALLYGTLVALIVRALQGQSWQPFRGFSPAWIGRGYALAVVTVIVTNLLMTSLLDTAPRSSNPLLGLFTESSAWQFALLGVMVVVVGPLFEELLFRGWLLGGLRQKMGTPAALFLSAALFSLIHGDLLGTPALFGLGLVFGWVYLRSGSLLACVIVHGMWNATTLSILLSGI